MIWERSEEHQLYSNVIVNTPGNEYSFHLSLPTHPYLLEKDYSIIDGTLFIPIIHQNIHPIRIKTKPIFISPTWAGNAIPLTSPLSHNFVF